MPNTLEEILGDLREITVETRELITRSQLAQRLLDLKGSSFITFTALTDTDAKKTGNPFPLPITKRSKVRGVVNFQYVEGVLRRLEKEGKPPDAYKKGDSWHRPVLSPDGKLTPLSCHKKDASRRYIRFMYLDTLGRPAFFDATGRERTLEEVAPFLKVRSEYKNQGLDAPLQFHLYGINGIERADFAGNDYTVSEPVLI